MTLYDRRWWNEPARYYIMRGGRIIRSPPLEIEAVPFGNRHIIDVTGERDSIMGDENILHSHVKLSAEEILRSYIKPIRPITKPGDDT